MKKLSLYIAGAALMVLPTSCIQEFPAQQNGYVTTDQAADAPGSFDNFVSAIIDNNNGEFTFTGSSYQKSNDFGYSSFYLDRDVMGDDIVAYGNNWFSPWYEANYSLGPTYLNCQYPWTFYYRQIRACNTVLGMAGDDPDDSKKSGAGIAYTMRALYYLELAQMFAPQTYGSNDQALTVPIVTDKTTTLEAQDNPCATNKEMYEFILSDLDKAEVLLADYKRSDKYTPDVSVVNGLRARAYLIMRDWANAEKYAKLAAQGYEVLTAEQYTDRTNGFNNANWGNSWMFAMQIKPTDTCQTYNDGDNSWGTWMICEFPSDSSGLGYYNTYGGCMIIDRHLYETVPATDCRKKCFLDFAIDEMETEEEVLTALAEYSDVPEYVYGTGLAQEQFGGLSLKFRSKGGNHDNPQYVGWCVDLPIMRVEEMKLIEAEAAGMQDEGRGKALLEAFAKTRDPQYVYGQHNEAYYNTKTPAFQNEVWWQRRIEFWAEGLATFDIKRLEKGIIRSYPNSNHNDGYRWNMQETPNWMNLCIIQTESNYNKAIVSNPAPVTPDGNSPEYTW
ncbi:MAG: RagB/SusD family nutrient uptake outer membrane protein [Muribaculaceae bacterium]|nr:RagB/SusD family nutrient uptake outer membrane protein [Muribaculaceae bacterium]MDE6551446.1 RagB/SusD family nutrient uptake outer membrane protein [Muribaculaceae bacterium]